MAIRPILEAPDPRLRTISTPVEAIDDDLQTLIDDMFETMYDAPGIGLAAIQVGVPKRVLVIDLQPDDPDAEPFAGMGANLMGAAGQRAELDEGPTVTNAQFAPAGLRRLAC